MRALTLAAKLDKIGVGRSNSRPQVSNNNPFSESLFHTLKYHPSHTVCGFLQLKRRPASGFWHSSPGTTANIAIVASST